MKPTTNYFLSQQAIYNKSQQRHRVFKMDRTYQMFCRNITIHKDLQRLAVIAGLLGGLLLTGCGQKGDLYLPNDSNNIVNQNDSNQNVFNENISDSANMSDNLNSNEYDERLDDSPLELDNPLSY